VRALLVTAPGRYGLRELPDPEPGPGQVLVAPTAVGVCGSDLELLDGRRPAPYVRYPVVPGHEWVGTILGVGPGVDGLRIGAPVVAEGVVACGVCARCAEGRTNVCAGPYDETGFTRPGALAERLVVPARQVHVLPGDRPIAAAVLIEPAACVATGLLEVGPPAPGARVAVVGDGPVGLLAVALLRLSSPSQILLYGSRPAGVASGKRLGATSTVLHGSVTEAEEAALRGGFDLVIEAANAPAGAATALRLARRAGTVILLGISGTGRPALDPDAISLNHLRVQGVFAASRAAWQSLVQLYGAGLFDPAELITHRFGLAEAEKAFAVLGDRQAGALKVIIEPQAG
jgi:threonine dehydrogenase-like Zn-dependent dehydrogenase